MKTNHSQHGFTLLEVLVAISILVVVTSIVYASLTSVTTATEIARVSADEMRMRQFLVNGFQQNFSTIVCDPLFQDERYVLIGVSEDGPRGPMDSLEFACSAPVIGGMSPPGAIKRVYYGAAENSGGGGLGDEASQPVGAMKLESSEMMMLDPAVAEEYGTDFFGDGGGTPDNFGQGNLGRSASSGFSRGSRGFGDRSFSGSSSDSFSGDSRSDRRDLEKRREKRSSSSRRGDSSKRESSLLENQTQESPGWNVPCDVFDVSFFDGYEWVEDWDSIEFGQMPWAVRIRLNYARTDEEYDADREAGISQDKDFDFEMVYTIPIGAGLLSEEERMNNAAGMRTNTNGELFGNRNTKKDKGKDRNSKDSHSSKDNNSNRSNRNSSSRGNLFGN